MIHQHGDLPLDKHKDGIGRWIFNCQLCNYTGVHSGTAKRHVKSVHFRNPLCCPTCKDIFASHVEVLNHLKYCPKRSLTMPMAIGPWKLQWNLSILKIERGKYRAKNLRCLKLVFQICVSILFFYKINGHIWYWTILSQ